MQDQGATGNGSGTGNGDLPPIMMPPPPARSNPFPPLPPKLPPLPPPPGAIWRRRGIPLWAIAIIIIGALLWGLPFGLLIPVLGPAFSYGRALQAQVPAGSPPERIYTVMGGRGYACALTPGSGFTFSLLSHWHLFERVRWDHVITCQKTIAALDGPGFTPDVVAFRIDHDRSIGFTAISQRHGQGHSSHTSVTMGQ